MQVDEKKKEEENYGVVIELSLAGRGYKALFCPVSIIKALLKLGQIPKKHIYPRSHKCEFRFNKETLLTEFRIRTNTYVRMAKRSWRNDPSTGVMLNECLTPLVWGMERAATYPQFLQNYQVIRDGLYGLMICYTNDTAVQQVIAALLDCMPRDLKIPGLSELQ